MPAVDVSDEQHERSKLNAILQDSGKRRQFTTGAQRDRDAGKLRCDLMNPLTELVLSMLNSSGAIKYDPRNYEKGMPASEFLASAERHRLKFKLGMKDEDHLIMWVWNILGIVMMREGVALEIYPAEMWDLDFHYGDTDALSDKIGDIEQQLAIMAQKKERETE